MSKFKDFVTELKKQQKVKSQSDAACQLLEAALDKCNEPQDFINIIEKLRS